MSFVVVDMNTRCAVRHPRTGRDSYSTKAAAQAARTRYFRHAGYLSTELEVMTMDTYRAQVPTITVKNLITGKDVQIPADTPWGCRPDSESYWNS